LRGSFPAGDATGMRANDVCTEKLQVHPELASGASSSPPAGIRLIQQPGRVSVVTFFARPLVRSNWPTVSLRKKNVEAEAEMFPQPVRFFATHGHFQSSRAPVRRS